MKVYELTLAEGQEWAMPKVLEDNYVLSDLRGQPQLHWIPIGMDLLTEDDEGTPRGYSDFPWYGSHVLILRTEAANGLRETMRPYGEFLPLKGGDGLELFSATTVLDALDEDQSEIIRFDDGDILNIERYVFRQEAVGNCPIFKLFSGIGFKLVWSDEIDPVREVILPPRGQPARKRRWWQR